MRYYLTGLSIIFFALSFFVIVKTLTISTKFSQETIIPPQPSVNTKISANNIPTNRFEQNNQPPKAKKQIIHPDPAIVKTRPTPKTETKPQNEKPSQAQPLESLTLAVIGDVAFQADKISPKPNIMKTLDELSKAIKAFGNYRLIIEGHTRKDPTNPDSAKMYSQKIKLSYLKAISVTEVLVKNGVPTDKISAIGFVDPLSADSQINPDNLQEQSKVVIKLIPE